jgi:uncharacterized protein YqeY
MTLKTQIFADMKSTMKSGDKDQLKVLRLILAAIQQIEIDKRITLSDTDVLGILKKMVKQRYDSISLFKKGNRVDLANIELAEIAVLETYLPEQLSEAELTKIIDQVITDNSGASMRDMGKIMNQIKVKTIGRADMGSISTRVKKRLGAT